MKTATKNNEFYHDYSGEQWKVRVVEIKDISRNKSILSSQEMRELESISFEPRRDSWWKARETLKSLTEETGETYAGLRKGENGKPHFIKGTKFQCSLSHSSTLATAMLSKKSCGVDIEEIRPKIERIFSKFGSPEELKWENSIRFITTIWACKESIYKAVDTPGILFREQILFQDWNSITQVAGLIYKDLVGEEYAFECQVHFIDNHVLAFTL